MARKRFTTEQIIGLLREAEVRFRRAVAGEPKQAANRLDVAGLVTQIARAIDVAAVDRNC